MGEAQSKFTCGEAQWGFVTFSDRAWTAYWLKPELNSVMSSLAFSLPSCQGRQNQSVWFVDAKAPDFTFNVEQRGGFLTGPAASSKVFWTLIRSSGKMGVAVTYLDKVTIHYPLVSCCLAGVWIHTELWTHRKEVKGAGKVLSPGAQKEGRILLLIVCFLCYING